MPEHAGLAQAITELTSLDSSPYSLPSSPRSSLPLARPHDAAPTTLRPQEGSTTFGHLMANRTAATQATAGTAQGARRDERYYTQENEQAWGNHQLRQSALSSLRRTPRPPTDTLSSQQHRREISTLNRTIPHLHCNKFHPRPLPKPTTHLTLFLPPPRTISDSI